MPETKIYMAVTNDEYELPTNFRFIGAKAAAEFLGISVNGLRQRMCRYQGCVWPKIGKYKVVAVDAVYIRKRHKRVVYRQKNRARKEYFHERWLRKHEEIIRNKRGF